MKSPDVLLLTQEDQTIAAVRSVLEFRAIVDSAGICGTMMDLRTRLSREPTNGQPRIAVVDIDRDPDRLLSELSMISTAYLHTWFIVISKEFDERRVLRAMQAGARHFLRKSAIATDLNQVLERLLVQGPQASSRLGTIVSVFSCGGGCGATTVAVNLASELRLALVKRVLIVDLDQHYGAAATYLGITGRYGIGHVLGRQGPVDRHLIESTAVTHGEGLDMMLSPAIAEADAGVALNYDRLLVTLEACRESYDYIVADAPRIPREVMADLASVSRINLIVLQLTVRDVAFASSMVSFLVGQGIGRERILALANRVRRRGPLLRLEDSRRAIGVDVLHPIRSDWVKAVKSVNQGRPLCDVAGRSRLRRDYRRLAAQIHEGTSNGGYTHQESDFGG
jgi:pilus assembly protein CpaE